MRRGLVRTDVFGMRRTTWIGILSALTLALLMPATAEARGGDYVFDGGSSPAQAEVRRALDASGFDWSIVPARVTVHIRPGVPSHATPGHIWLDEDLLRAGRFAWAVVQDEYAHQVDFFLFDDAMRARLTRELGARTWCRSGGVELPHSAYGCERFASTLVWTYWQSPHNAYRPTSRSDEAAALPPHRFRLLLTTIVPQVAR